MAQKQTSCIKDADVFKECDGYWRAVIVGGNGNAYNVAPHNCRTKKEAVQSVRECL